MKSGIGTGAVTSDIGGINCGAACSAEYMLNSSVTLTATADPYSSFVGWFGGGCSGAGTCSVTMNDDTTVTANFTAS